MVEPVVCRRLLFEVVFSREVLGDLRRSCGVSELVGVKSDVVRRPLAHVPALASPVEVLVRISKVEPQIAFEGSLGGRPLTHLGQEQTFSQIGLRDFPSASRMALGKSFEFLKRLLLETFVHECLAVNQVGHRVGLHKLRRHRMTELDAVAADLLILARLTSGQLK